MTIKALRQSVNMTQSQLAEWLSTSIENIKNWERGKSQPSEMLMKLISYYVEGHKQGTQLTLDEKKTFYVHKLLNWYGDVWSERIYHEKTYSSLIEEHNYWCKDNSPYSDKIYKCKIIEEIKIDKE